MTSALKERLAQDGCLFGLILKMPSQAIIELAGAAGFDVVLIDTEHGPADDAMLENHLRSARLAGVESLVRLGRNDPLLILRALDAGASGIVVPHVTSVAEATSAVRAAHYPPFGSRGLAVSTVAGHHGTVPLPVHLKNAESTFVMAQAEDAAASDNMAGIARVEGLDAVWIGPSDLSMSLGHPGQYDHPNVVEAVDHIAETVTASASSVLCVLVDTPAEAAHWAARGARLIMFTSTTLMHQALHLTLDHSRRRVTEGQGSDGRVPDGQVVR